MLIGDGPLFRRPGIVVTHGSVDVGGRCYSVAQINSVKVGPAIHPKATGLVVVLIVSALALSLILFGDLLILVLAERWEQGVYPLVGGISMLGAVFFVPGVVAVRELRRFPRWASLRLGVSGREVRVLSAERSEVEMAVASIQAAMAE